MPWHTTWCAWLCARQRAVGGDGGTDQLRGRVRWLRGAEEGEEMPELVVNPSRPGRYEPRVRKRRPKQYPLMKKPRAELPSS